VGVLAAMSLHSAGLTLDPLPAAALKAYRDMIVEVAPTNGAWNVPHWPAHWLEYNYAGPEASLDSAWRAHHAYIEYELRDGEGVPFSTAAEFKEEYDGRWESMSREVAFAGLANVYAEKAGFARKLDSGSPHTQNPSGTLLECLVIWAESHLMEWRTQQSANPNGGRCARSCLA